MSLQMLTISGPFNLFIMFFATLKDLISGAGHFAAQPYPGMSMTS